MKNILSEDGRRVLDGVARERMLLVFDFGRSSPVSGEIKPCTSAMTRPMRTHSAAWRWTCPCASVNLLLLRHRARPGEQAQGGLVFDELRKRDVVVACHIDGSSEVPAGQPDDLHPRRGLRRRELLRDRLDLILAVQGAAPRDVLHRLARQRVERHHAAVVLDR
jgi:hypothetical protein